MTRLTTVTVRLRSMEIAALDALTEREGGTRTQKVRESISLRLNVEATRGLLVDAVRSELRSAKSELLEAAQASDATSRKLITDFLEALGTHVDEPITEPASAHDTAGGTKMPRRRD